MITQKRYKRCLWVLLRFKEDAFLWLQYSISLRDLLSQLLQVWNGSRIPSQAWPDGRRSASYVSLTPGLSGDF